MNMHQGGCLTGLGDTNRIRGHSGSDSLFIFRSPHAGKVRVKSLSQGMVTQGSHQLDWLDLTGFVSL